MVLLLVTLAGGSVIQATSLALAILLIEFAIGAANDWFDVELDSRTKPSKPISAGLIERRDAALVAFTTAGAGLVLAAVSPGAAEPQPLVFGTLLLGVGLAYDAYLKRTPLSWLCFSAAFALVLVFSWSSVPSYCPVAGPTVLAVALICGPAIQLANAVVDLERDRSVGLRTLAVVLGHRGTIVVLAAAQILIQVIVWSTLRAFASLAPTLVVVLIGLASALSIAGVALSAAGAPRIRALGWSTQALGLALLTIGWTMLRTPDQATGA